MGTNPMNFRPTVPSAAVADAELVAACLAGERAAFAQIVERYQRLLCSLAYAATGSVGESEDIAQETFIVAWGKLGELREPDKLRPWLCSILRFKIGHVHRRRGRDAIFGAEPVDSAGELAGTETSAADRAMQEEEQTILRHALAQLPETYREPLVLYYRENRSVEHVAAALDLSEDAVKQRLARGRKLLQEQVLALVENALARTTPGKAFTLGVLAALPAFLPVPAKAAGIGGALVAQGGAMAKTTAWAAWLASASGVASAVMQLRLGLDQARTSRERRAVVKSTIVVFFGTLAYLGLLWGLREVAVRQPEWRVPLAVVAQVLIVALIAVWPWMLLRLMRYFRRLRSEERRLNPDAFSEARDQVGSSTGVLRSRASLFGVPLLHVRFSSPDEGEGPVVGWIAAGDRAYGLLFAWGGVAVAPICVGGFAAGFVSIGAVSVGVIGLGTFAVGLLAIGGIAVGLKAFAGLSALGWFTAQSNGFGIARVAAEAPVALAQYTNDATARALLHDPRAQQNQMIFLIVVTLAVLIPMTVYAGEVRRRLGGRRQQSGSGAD